MKTKPIKNEKYITSILGFGWYTNTRDWKNDKHQYALTSNKVKSIEF